MEVEIVPFLLMEVWSWSSFSIDRRKEEQYQAFNISTF